MADQLGKSIGDLYRGALVPGLMLMGLYAGYVFVMSWLRPASVPAFVVCQLVGGALGLAAVRWLFPHPQTTLEKEYAA